MNNNESKINNNYRKNETERDNKEYKCSSINNNATLNKAAIQLSTHGDNIKK